MKDNNRPLHMEHFFEVTNYMMNGVLEMIKHADGTSEIVYANNAAASLLCYNRNEAVGQLDNDPYAFVYPADRERVRQAIALCGSKEDVKETYRVYDKDGEIVWVLAHFHSMMMEDELHIVIIYSNISELMGTQARLQSEGDKLLDIINSIPMGIAIFEIDDNGKTSTLSLNDQMILFADSVGKILDGNSRRWTKEELSMVFNQSIYAFCDNEDAYLVKEMLDGSKTEPASNCIFRLRGSTEEKPIYIKSTCSSKPVSDNTRTYYVTFENVTKDKLQEIELAKKQEMLTTMSYYDALSNVNNRHSYNEYVENCKTNPVNNTGFIFADLNGLKRVNDVLGHKYGDEMIVRFVNILTTYFETGNVFRLSGDEFVVINPDVCRSYFNSQVEGVLKDVAEAENIASIGYVWEERVSDIKHAIGKAEQIMYVEKQKYYELEKHLKSKHRPLLLNSLFSDFENNRFRMYLQPKADAKTSKVIGAEALVRKLDDNGGIVPPIEFIPQLEKERLIPKIDFFMLEEVCKFLENLKKEGKEDFIISVNMSRVTLVENDYIEQVKDIIGKYDFNIGNLEFEITESNETMDSRRLEDYILQIKELGIRISLDDVGTDYSSFPMLILDGIDCVKLDRSLITKISSPKANLLLRHVIRMSHDLGMEVIAEGIETEENLEEIGNIDCDSFQGYLLSKPIPADEFKTKYCI